MLAVGGIAAGVAVAFSRGANSTAGEVEFTRPLAIPPLAGSSVEDGVRVFSLDLQEGETDLGQGGLTPTLGVNGTFLGPTLRATRGEQVRVEVTNSMTETSTLHWHGMKLPAVMDGGPHQQVAPGQTWSPTWLVDQPAATLWYHPHLHGRTADHVYRGLAASSCSTSPTGHPRQRSRTPCRTSTASTTSRSSSRTRSSTPTAGSTTRIPSCRAPGCAAR
ncbi:multicopper oxidase domain-containing protein [Oerskovia sp. M15]